MRTTSAQLVQHVGFARRLASALVGDFHLAEDVSQDALADLLTRPAETLRNPRAYLMSSMRHGASRSQRSGERRLARERAVARPEHVQSTAAIVEAMELHRRIVEALLALEEPVRDALILRYFESLPPREIAQRMCLPVETVRTRIKRGLKKLRQKLDDSVSGDDKAWFAVLAPLSSPETLEVTAAGSAKTIIAGVLVMSVRAKLACVAVSAILLGSHWVLREPSSIPSSTLAVPEVSGSETAELSAPKGKVTMAETPRLTPLTPEPVAVNPTGLLGSAALEFVWEHDGSPAPNLLFSGEDMTGTGGGLFKARTNQQGLLALDGMKPGSYFLSGRLLKRKLVINAGEVTRERIELEAEQRITGIVVDRDGRGVPDADIWVKNFAAVDDEEPRLVATSGPGGIFDGAVDLGGYVWARKRGYVPSPCDRTADKSGTQDKELDLRLVLGSPGCGAGGVVVGAVGRPIPNARLTILDQTNPRTFATPVVLHTDALGAFDTRELAPGKHFLVAQASGHAATPLWFTASEETEQVLQVCLHLGATLAGSVRTSSWHAIEAKLQARPAWVGEAGFEALRPIRHLGTVRGISADGRYRLEHVPIGAVTLEALTMHGMSVPKELVLEEDSLQACDVVFDVDAEIRGRLVDAYDAPVASWNVFANPVGGGMVSGQRTNELGEFVLTGLDAADYVVTASPPGGSLNLPWASAAGVQPGPDVLLLRVEYKPKDGGRFTGQVIGAGSEQNSRAWLIARDENQRRTLEVFPDSDGVFKTDALPPGRYRVSVSLEGQGVVGLGQRDLHAREDVYLGVIRAPATGRLEIHLVAPTGDVLEPIKLLLKDSAGNFGTEFDRIGDGGWRSKPLPAGTYTLSAWGERFARIQKRVELLPKQTTWIEVVPELATPVRFELRCGEHAGEGVSHLAFKVSDAVGERVLTHTIVAEDGAIFTFGFAAGSYTYEARVAGRRGEPVRGAFEVGGGETHHFEVRLPGSQR